jgi:hypothetical protein
MAVRIVYVLTRNHQSGIPSGIISCKAFSDPGLAKAKYDEAIKDQPKDDALLHACGVNSQEYGETLQCFWPGKKDAFLKDEALRINDLAHNLIEAVGDPKKHGDAQHILAIFRARLDVAATLLEQADFRRK